MDKYTLKARAEMLQYLLSDRCANYGYDWAMFRNVCQQRYRAKQGIKNAKNPLQWDKAPLAHRLNWDTMDYTVGQSSNEEITNLLRQLVNPNAQWVS